MPRLVDLGPTGSAYLDQHVANPVQWWSWGADAFAEARRLDRPVFLSVGYAACHWCHVMAHESFEDESVAAALNDSFVSIKVDREQRPDVDAAYMAATQLLTGHGGWPMSVFLTPDGDPFYAGTYFPPADRPGAVGFPRLLAAMAEAWASRRDAVLAQAEELRAATAREVAVVDHLAPAPAGWDLARARQVLRDDLVERCDAWGGFGPAPKFPRADYVTALLDFTDDVSRAAVTRTLDAMARGGLYDHLGGGFARYSVDGEWRVPHFEKMLYDQALLARAYLLADRSRGGATPWRAVALDTIDFVRSRLKVAAGFASSLDADAAGVEGSHVTWTPEEARACLEAAGLGALADAALARWSLEGAPDLDGRNVPRLGDGEPFATPAALAGARDALVASRARRPQPGLDEKVVLEWNAMFASALLGTRDPAYEAEGLGLLASLRATHRAPEGWWRTERPGARATAHDLAWLVDAQVDAFEVTGEDAWIEGAREVAADLLARHWEGPVPSAADPGRGAGLLTPSSLVADLAVRAKDVFDGATPSAHGVATRARARLARVSGDADTLAVARRLVDLGATLISAHPSAVPVLVDAARYALEGVEVVVPGPRGALADHVRSTFVARSVLVTGTGSSPLLAGRLAGHVYLCRGGVCQLPVTTREGFDAQVAELD
ncbi:MAG: thioredoxin domain-containing protein [Acidobacteriota bacterium]|nr:thioredoxin domain-containing protein [Acidobacteriota bacterium]